MSKEHASAFMINEIHEQPDLLSEIIDHHTGSSLNQLQLLKSELSTERLNSFENVLILGMGTSLHAGMVAKLWFERIAKVKSESDNSSEFKDRNPIINKNTLAISISQSGETADTLSAIKTAKEMGATVLNISNSENSTSNKLADYNLPINAGEERSIAATKSFTCSLLQLYILAIKMGNARKSLNQEESNKMVDELKDLPRMLDEVLKIESQIEQLAEQYYAYKNFLYLGRNLNYPIALEGALKLKEVSYIHAEGYPSGELKHGPLALIDSQMATTVIMPKDSMFVKNLNIVKEIKSKGGKVISITSNQTEAGSNKDDDTIYIPDTSELISPVLTCIPLQLFSYFTAIKLGRNVDKPRNLSKSVTVE
mgnify:FL=1|jgi:glucosamine--fructose-6-phosphate aminotransferase (isomerizing)|tara:strand:- start:36253 stop:37356 length:1104 start_codon:yes stop_codon:yes gene_type:complete